MRCWPYQMLSVLPSKHILSQWRECLAISGMIKLNEKVNHYIINRINNYSIDHFILYCTLVIEEFKRRDYTIGTDTIEKLNQDINFEDKLKTITLTKEDLFKGWHNFDYIEECIYKFQYKYDLGFLRDEEWDRLVSYAKSNNILMERDSNSILCNLEVRRLVLSLCHFEFLRCLDERELYENSKVLYDTIQFIKSLDIPEIELIRSFVSSYAILINLLTNSLSKSRFRNQEIKNEIISFGEDDIKIDRSSLETIQTPRLMNQNYLNFREIKNCRAMEEDQWNSIERTCENLRIGEIK